MDVSPMCALNKLTDSLTTFELTEHCQRRDTRAERSYRDYHPNCVYLIYARKTHVLQGKPSKVSPSLWVHHIAHNPHEWSFFLGSRRAEQQNDDPGTRFLDGGTLVAEGQ